MSDEEYDYATLAKMRKQKLHRIAEDFGLADPESLGSKADIAQAIINVQEAKGEVEPAVEITITPDIEQVVEEVDDDMIWVVVTGSHFGYNKLIYSKGQKLRVPRDVEARNALISIPFQSDAQDEITRLKKENLDLIREREAGK